MGKLSEEYAIQDLVDVNGDGLPDVVAEDSGEWVVQLNMGGKLEPLRYVPSEIQPEISYGVANRIWEGGGGHLRKTVDHHMYADLVDLNGDGFLDRVNAQDNPWQVQLNQHTQRPNLLTVMENGLGGTNTIVYDRSTMYDNTGGDGVSDLPFVTWVVAGTRMNDGLCTPAAGTNVFDPAENECIDAGHDLVSTFFYQDGRFDPESREFRGFRRVIRSTVEGSQDQVDQTETYFGQGSATKGRVLSVTTYAGTGAVDVQEKSNVWMTDSDTGSDRVRLWLSQTATSRFDLDGPGGSLQYVETFNDPPDEYGNVTHRFTEGIYGIHRVDTHTEYADGSLVHDKPSHVWTMDGSTKLEEKWFQYEDDNQVVLPIGQAGKGNVREVKSWLDTDPSGPGSITQMITTRTATSPRSPTRSATRRPPNTTMVSSLPAHCHEPAATVKNDRDGLPLGQARLHDRRQRCSYLLRLRRCGENDLHHAADGCNGRLLDVLRLPVRYPAWRAVDGSPLGRAEPVAAARDDAVLRRPGAPAVYRYLPGRRRRGETVRTQQVDYDGGGRVVKRYDPYLASAPAPDNGSTQIDYHLNGSSYVDPLGRPYLVLSSDGTSQRTEYHGKQPIGYDEEDNKAVSIGDAFGRVVEKQVYDGQTLYAKTAFTYDGLGRLTETKQNDDSTPMIETTYDSLGRKTQTVDRDSGTWTYQYDAAGHLLFQDDPKAGQSTYYCYDAGGRVTRKATLGVDVFDTTSHNLLCESGVAGDIEYGYDDVAGGNKGVGRLTSVSDAEGSSELTYDGRGRVTAQRRTISVGGDSKSAVTRFVYDRMDRIQYVVYPDGEVVVSNYDASGQPLALTEIHGYEYVSDVRYDVLGRPTRITHGNGVVDTRQYSGADKRHRLDRLTTSLGTTSYMDLEYTSYTPRGLLQSVTDWVHPYDPETEEASYTYDFLGRLRQANSTYTDYDTSYDYDALGNIKQKGERYFFYEDAAHPHQVTRVQIGQPGGPEWTVDHDANGNRVQREESGQGYTYDGDDRLQQISLGPEPSPDTVSFLYDEGGQMSAKIAQVGGVASMVRYYNRYVETGTDGVTVKWYFLGGMRVASRHTNDVSWEEASAAGAGAGDGGPLVEVASRWIGRPVLVVLVGRKAEIGLAAAVLLVGTGLLVAPWRRRRRVLGVRVRHGHVIGLVVLFTLGTLPWPLVVRPAWADDGCGGPTPTPGPSYPYVLHYHLNHLGSTQIITGEEGNLVEEIHYSAYGEIRGQWNEAGTSIDPPEPEHRREFTGYETEGYSGLEYAGARFYDPQMGTFLTHDPMRQFANPYAYGPWDPVNGADSHGEFWFIPAVIAVVSAFVAAHPIITAAVVGGVLGGVNSAVTGQNVFQGIALGVGLGIVGGAAFATGNFAVGIAGGAAVGAAQSAATGQNVLYGALIGAGFGAIGAYSGEIPAVPGQGLGASQPTPASRSVPRRASARCAVVSPPSPTAVTSAKARPPARSSVLVSGPQGRLARREDHALYT